MGQGGVGVVGIDTMITSISLFRLHLCAPLHIISKKKKKKNLTTNYDYFQYVTTHRVQSYSTIS